MSEKKKPTKSSPAKRPEPKKEKAKASGTAFYLRIALPLLLICTVCAALLGASYLLTYTPIKANEDAAVTENLTEIYGNGVSFEPVAIPENQKATAAWRVTDAGSSLIGYAVRTVSAGFSDDIDLIVGFDTSLSIRQIKIIAISETSGLGSRVGETEYLNNYIGKSGEKLSLGEDVDAITGATKSSKALNAGVNNALACVQLLAAS